ncbi:hypothetical protein AB0N81_00265 [Streptomyces sp. NPDC093510]|uniref:hypothetical protein n=1 Tax=Streptomyces sp. NPDC093510 TaxID=3155199 RepID=UPI00343A2153
MAAPATSAGAATAPPTPLRRVCQTLYSEIPHAIQDAVLLRRLQQMVNTVLLNPLWRERLRGAGITHAPQSYEEWQRIPLSDKEVQRDFFMDTRPGMVVPLTRGELSHVRPL